MKVFAFFLLNYALKSFVFDGSTHVLGKKLNSSLNALAMRPKLRARLFFLARAAMPGWQLIL